MSRHRDEARIVVCSEAGRRPTTSAAKAWIGCAAAALALHAWMLAQWPRPPMPTLPLTRSRALQVQLTPAAATRPSPSLAPPPGSIAVTTGGAGPTSDHDEHGNAERAMPHAKQPPASVAAVPQRSGRGAPSRAAPAGTARPARAAATEPATEPATEAETETQPAAPQAPGPRSQVAAATPATALALPVYPTALPTGGHWRYRLLHNGREGDAELQWQHDGERYRATLDATDADGSPVLSMSSRGRLDDAGLAPERFVDRRGRRSAQAANFQRDDGAITYSGPALRAPLPVGAQDRLSLWLQLAAIVAAEPGRWRVGSTITTYASGAHGDAEVWLWQVQGLEPADADADADAGAPGPPARRGARLLKLRREAPRLYDTEAEAWLDPARGYLPQRMRWRNGAHVVELRLQR